MDHSAVSPMEVYLFRGPLRIVDVRDPCELNGPLGHVGGVENVPFGELALVAAGWRRDERIVVLCRSGGRSARAADLLFELGFTRVHDLIGGMMAWSFEGLPVERPTLAPVDRVRCGNSDRAGTAPASVW